MSERLGPREALNHALFGLIPLLFTAIAVVSVRSGHIASDFHSEFYPAAGRVLHGGSPYDLGRHAIDSGDAFPYPALTALLFAPFALLHPSIAESVYIGINIVVLLATLRVLQVRDWRLYGMALLWAPVYNAWQSGNLTLLLCLGMAVMWRYRERPAGAGLAAAVIVSLKPFVWPAGLWLLATKRYRAAAWALASGLAINFVSFAALGFNEISRYLQAGSDVTSVFYKTGFSLVAFVMHLGASESVGVAFGVAASAVAAVALFKLGQSDGARALAACVALALLASPVIWNHYFTLLIVPLAIARPKLSAVWALPLLMWACLSRSSTTLSFLIVGFVAAGVLSACLSDSGLARRVRARPVPGVA
jgi:alpha-1,2-mannosyltransferase